MLTKVVLASRRFSLLLTCVLLLLVAGLWLRPIDAADNVTATKDCITSACTVTEAQFTIPPGPGQVIHWQATYTGGPTQGHSFYLSTVASNLADIPLTTSGQPAGDQFLAAGTYHISIRTALMGPGSYTITFNRTASIAVSPSNHPFGNQLAGTSSAEFTFSPGVSSAGDVPVTIASVTSSDPAHFQVTSAPTGQQVPPSKTFKVKFNAGTTPGPFSATITVTGTSPLPGTVMATTMVSGTTVPNVPNISCLGGSCGAASNLGSADGDTGEVKTFNMTFQNTGTAQLTLTSINLFNDSPGGVFSLAAAPSTAPIAPSGSRTVQVRFAPPAGEATYCGHLVIQSNDPDEPTKQCFFQARGHHPVPKMRLEANLLNYRQVELGFSFTKAIVVFNDGDAPLVVTASDICTGDPLCAPNLVHWSSLELGGPFTINPGAPPKALKEIYKPQALGIQTIRLRVTGNDLTSPMKDVTLTGEGIAPIPIDSVLVLDRSGSMADSAGPRRKIDALQTAADLFVHLLRPETGSGTGDKIGLVRYNQNNDIYLPLNFMTPNNAAGTQLAQAEDKLSPAAVADSARLAPAGTTGIGGAIQRAAGMLVPPNASRKHVMVLLTDGIENEPPFISAVLNPVRSADPDLKMYSIGLGSQVDPSKLQLITNVVNGYHQVVDDLSGTSRFDLETFYFKIFSNATGMSLVVDPTSVIYLNGANPVIVQTAQIVSSDRNATFLVLDDPALRAFYNLELVDPHGQVIVLGTTVGGTPVQELQRFNYTIYKIIFPDEALAATYVGDWVLRLTPNGKWSPAAVREALAHNNQGRQDFINPYQGLVPIGFAVAVSSDYRMDVNVLPSNYLPGANVKLTASLSDRGAPTVGGDVFVNVTTPNGTAYAGVRLYDDGTHGDAQAGDGTWTTDFTQTAETGSYKFFFHAIGKNERGELVPREDTRYATLMPLSKDPPSPDKPCISCRLLWLLWILLIGLLLLIAVSLLRRFRST